MAADPTPVVAGVAEARFRVMGSDAHLVIDGNPSLLDRAAARLFDLESRWSRFLPDSEVSGLAGAGGEIRIVSQETYRLISTALDAWDLTGGRFDPTVLGDVIRAGYDRSFEDIPAARAAAPASRLGRGAGRIALFPSANGVALPDGVGFDPGGLGKGLAADIVTAELLAAGAAGACVNVGGDLRVAGTRAGEASWGIAIDPLHDGEVIATLAIGAGAVATSTRARRSWEVGGATCHHLIDPTSGQPAGGDILAVSVVAGECWQAEALAKAAFLAGPGPALQLVEDADASCIVVTTSGRILHSDGMVRYLVPGSSGTAPTPDAGVTAMVAS